MHLYYVPLIPLSSWLVPYGSVKKSELEWQRIRLSAKSVMVGWLQGFLVVFGLMEVGWGVLCLSAPRLAGINLHDTVISLVLGLASLVVLLLLRIRPLRADHERANQLRTQLGLDVKVQEERFDFPTE